MKWTEKQLKAIEASGNLLVAAAAGSGKTAVLTERIVRLVKQGADLTRMLVVTYTKAAAGEMRQRIEARLHEAAEETEEGTASSRRLHEAAESAARASISTLHSFCAEVLRRHFQEAGLDPAFRIADDAETALLKQDALDAVLEEGCASGGVFTELLQVTGGLEKLSELILRLHTYLFAQPDPEAWLARAVERYAISAEELRQDPMLTMVTEESRRRLTGILEQYQLLMQEVQEFAPEAASVMAEDLLNLEEALHAADFESYGAALKDVQFSKFVWPRGIEDAMKKPYRTFRDRKLKAEVEKQRLYFSRDLAQEADFLREMLPAVEKLAETLRRFDARYAADKAERGVIDYADMEHFTLRLFRDKRIAAEYRERFTHIFVDEYQDANRVQDCILSAICRPNNLFFVGDVKQSIYRFRMAEPGLFLDKYRRYDGSVGQRIDLNANFRSAENILTVVNDVFARVMSREVGELDYDDDAALFPGDAPPKGHVELDILTRENTFQEETAEQLEDAESEAILAARRIREIMDNEEYFDPKTGRTRRYRYADFAVLHRAVRSVADKWVETLSGEGIPAYAEVTGGYFEAVEVRVFLDFLRVIDNRQQDIPMLAVLRSPVVGFTTEELIALRQSGEGSFFDCLTRVAVLEEETYLSRKAARVLARISAWQRLSRLLSVEEFIGRLLTETGYYDFVSALPGGSRRENLTALMDMARQYEKNGARSLHSFITLMDRVKNTNSVGVAQTAGADVVRVISIHRSKGLEFPVVILAGMGKNFNPEAAKQDFQLDADLGIGGRFTLGEHKRDSLYWTAIRSQHRLQDLSEEMRVLYVGMTRAKQQLILLASAKSTEELVNMLRRPLTPARVAEAKSHLELTLCALLQTSAGNALRHELGLLPLPGEPAADILMALPGARAGRVGRISRRQLQAVLSEAESAPATDRYDWSYPYAADTVIPAKISVSQLTGNILNLTAHPAFIQLPEEQAATDRGTAAHRLMELISIRPHTRDSVEEELSRLVQEGRITEGQARVIDPGATAAFFASPLGQRLIASPRRERELQFNYRIAASRLFQEETEATVLLQGVIDCCFLEENAWVIVDYKTDFVPAGRAEETARKHREQLDLYAEALLGISGLAVKERYIYLLRAGESVRV